MPKLVFSPFMKVCSLSFWALAVPSLGRSSFIWQPAGAPTSLTGSSLAIWKSLKKERFTEPVDYFLDYKDAVLTLHFTLPLKNPVKPKQLVLEVFDRSFFIDFQMAKDNPVKLVGAPAGCQMKLDRPSDGTATAQKLNEQTFMSGENTNFGMMFANKITVDCP